MAFRSRGEKILPLVPVAKRKLTFSDENVKEKEVTVNSLVRSENSEYRVNAVNSPVRSINSEYREDELDIDLDFALLVTVTVTSLLVTATFRPCELLRKIHSKHDEFIISTISSTTQRSTFQVGQSLRKSLTNQQRLRRYKSPKTQNFLLLCLAQDNPTTEG